MKIYTDVCAPFDTDDHDTLICMMDKHYTPMFRYPFHGRNEEWEKVTVTVRRNEISILTQLDNGESCRNNYRRDGKVETFYPPIGRFETDLPQPWKNDTSELKAFITCMADNIRLIDPNVLESLIYNMANEGWESDDLLDAFQLNPDWDKTEHFEGEHDFYEEDEDDA